MVALPQTRGSGIDLDRARPVCPIERRKRVGYRLGLVSSWPGLYGVHSWLDWVHVRVERVSRIPGDAIRNAVLVINLNLSSRRNGNGLRIGLSPLEIDLHWTTSNFD